MMLRRCSWRTCVLVSALTSAACANEEAATQLMIAVTADPAVADAITHLDVATCDAEETDAQGRPKCVDYHSFSFGRGGVNVLPLSFGITKRDSSRVLLMIGGYRDQEPVVEQKVYADFVPQQLHRVALTLSGDCADVICNNQRASLTTCYPDSEQRCVPVAVAETQRIEPMGEFEGLFSGDDRSE